MTVIITENRYNFFSNFNCFRYLLFTFPTNIRQYVQVLPSNKLFSNFNRQKALLSKICHKHPTMMKVRSYILPKDDPKNI